MRAAAADLLLGSRCAGCGRPGLLLCPGCAGALAVHPARCWPDPPPPLLVAAGVVPYAAAEYSGLLRALVVAYKDQNRAGLAEPLGRALATAVEHALDDRLDDRTAAVGSRAAVELVPVPSSRAGLRRRGRDPVADLARSTARRLRRRGWAVRVQRRLRHRRRVADQAGLGARDRAQNLRGALAAGPAPATARSVVRLLVDDVLTTGCTAEEGVRALLAAGHPVAAVVTVAATRRQRAARMTGG